MASQPDVPLTEKSGGAEVFCARTSTGAVRASAVSASAVAPAPHAKRCGVVAMFPLLFCGGAFYHGCTQAKIPSWFAGLTPCVRSPNGRKDDAAAILYAFDLIELDGQLVRRNRLLRHSSLAKLTAPAIGRGCES